VILDRRSLDGASALRDESDRQGTHCERGFVGFCQFCFLGAASQTHLGRQGPPGHHRSSSSAAVYPVAAVDDPSDELGVERAWIQRMTRRRAQERGWERARARAAMRDAAAEFANSPVEPAKRLPSQALLVHLANVRNRANAARWRGVEPVTRSALMSWVVRQRWARTTAEQRRAVGIALARAHWKHPDPAKIAPGGGVYR
jgi:hypothetical protein